MVDLSNFKRDQIVGTFMAGASVTKTAELFGEAMYTVSKVMVVFGKEGKNVLSEAKRRTLKWIVWKDYKKITVELNVLEYPASSKTETR